MQIVPATPSDATTLTALAFAAKRHWGYPEAWIEQWRDELTFTAAKIVGHSTFRAIEDHTIIGVYRLEIEAAEVELTDLWVLPAAMGRGVGRLLVEHAEFTARGLGCTRLHLASDPHAEAFYLRLGFRQHGTQDATMDGQSRVLPLLEKRL